MEGADLVGTARSGIPVLAAFGIARRPRQAASDGQGCVPLPSAEEQVCGAGSVAQELLAPANRQLVDRSQNKNAVAVPVLTSVALTQIRLVAAVVVISSGVRVEPLQRQAPRSPMVQFDLERSVGVGPVVAPVVEALMIAANHVGRYSVRISVGSSERGVVR